MNEEAQTPPPPDPTAPPAETAPRSKEVQMLEALGRARDRLMGEIRKVIIGQDDVIEQLLMCLLARGHCLLVGVPGLAKTLLVQTTAAVLKLSFNRIQFTPDLMPSDITGTEIIEEDRTTGRRAFRFVKGPIFANMILADEINRTPPKTQAALLQAMQENQVTCAGQTHTLQPPFFVMATQNPIEQEGTYPLPEAQLDRFMFHVNVDYPSYDEERQIVRATTGDQKNTPQPVLSSADILKLQQIIRRIPISDHVLDYAVALARCTRPNERGTPQFINDWLTWGAGPRAAQYLVLGAKARAALNGRLNISCGDVRHVAPPVLRHRIITNFNADADGIRPDDVIKKLLESIPEPSAEKYRKQATGASARVE